MRTTLRVLAAACVCALGATACVPPPPAEPPEPENLPPVAKLYASYTTTEINWSIPFHAIDSYDPDGEIVATRLDLGDGRIRSLPLPNWGVGQMFSWSELGTYTVTLTVTDDDGATATDSMVITVVPRGDGLPD